MKNKYAHIIYTAIILLVINFIGSRFYKRFDVTQDQRYSVSQTTKLLISNISQPLQINVYLKGDFPAEFKRLQIETEQYLSMLQSFNKNVQFKFINPAEIAQSLIENGLKASSLQIEEEGKLSEVVIFPWAVISYKNKKENVSLLKDISSNSQNEQLESSIQNLEFAFTNAIQKLTTPITKKIVVLKGNGELSDIHMADFLRKLNGYYHLAPFTLDSVASNPQKTLSQLNEFDLAIISKPTEKFSEEEKFTLDQFIMKGGKTLWMIDNVQAELDSLMETGEALAYPRDLGLTDLFFNYGIRINNDLIADLYCSEIPLATGNIGNKTQFSRFSWVYFPLLNSKNNHPINKNTAEVNLKFASSIDTLKNNISKTILLESSPLSKLKGTPSIISLQTIAQKPNPTTYNNGNIPMGVLLEGSFKSAYFERIKPFTVDNPASIGNPTKMVVISDGDIVANDISKGKPMELGLDKYTGQSYGNKEFLLSTVNYLLDDTGLMNIKSKNVKINFLDKQKAYEHSKKYQLLNLVVPLLLLFIFAVTFYYLRKKKFQ